MCDANILSQKGAAMISRCNDCGCLFLWNYNIVMNFSGTQFADFRNFTSGIAPDEYTLPFPDGVERLVLRTPARDINLTFTLAEWDDFQAAMEEATHMLEVYALMR